MRCGTRPRDLAVRRKSLGSPGTVAGSGRLRRMRAAAAFATIGCLALTACSSGNHSSDPNGSSSSSSSTAAPTAAGGSAGGASGSITFWTIENTPARLAGQQKVIDAFTKKTGIKVKLVGLSTAQELQTIVGAAAAGKLPDVILHTQDSTPGWVKQGILDSKAATAVINDLGADTFAKSALSFAKVNGEYGAVPSDGWANLIYYRKDLFSAAGLPVPDTFAKLETAAKTLNGKNGVYGMLMGTKAGDRYTLQQFENFAVANDCQLVNDKGDVDLASNNCVDAIKWYAEVAGKYSAGSAQDTKSTEATYLAGKAAIVSWSPYLLGPLAGLDPQNPTTCAQCKQDPQWLLKNTGIVPVIKGPDASAPSTYGQVLNLGITTHSNTAAAEKFVEYLLSDGYMDSLAVATQGRFPMRLGDKSDPQKFVNAWQQLPVGTPAKSAPVGQLLGADTVKLLGQDASNFQRWGFSQGQGPLETAVYGDLSIANEVNRAVTGALSADQAAKQMANDAKRVQSTLK